MIYKTLQEEGYIRLSPGVNFEFHSKGLKLFILGMFGLPLTQRVKILQKKLGASHSTTCI